ncbi:MAG: hypothetical protein ACOVOR_00400 [Rhabdochlamydiaceae bacterium]
MVRISKQQERRSKSPRKRRAPALKTGSKKDILPLGYKQHLNAIPTGHLIGSFIPKIKSI